MCLPCSAPEAGWVCLCPSEGLWKAQGGESNQTFRTLPSSAPCCVSSGKSAPL